MRVLPALRPQMVQASRAGTVGASGRPVQLRYNARSFPLIGNANSALM